MIIKILSIGTQSNIHGIEKFEYCTLNYIYSIDITDHEWHWGTLIFNASITFTYYRCVGVCEEWGGGGDNQLFLLRGHS